ncbi:MAG: tryptophan--tRNA ligase [Clostridia bacterium]|nr:tryptophan--tRNA ligase [Clostridia bacterium]MBR2398088.1 tryptophan--tRNA ligase [Clostridia bacterium]MBR6693047.1 tryptophan--tRNA ligase [Clostridia bacterium]
MEKKRLFSGIQPTGNITLGNYIGALKNFPEFQDEYQCIYSVVDLHAITVKQDPAILRKNAYELLSIYLACGLDPEKTVLFVQSHVPEHAELAWVLNTITYIGELNRMTQFKDKCAKHADNINMGLMDYPVLMASDILLYETALVPVGVDQKQHLELTRDLAIRFNSRYSPTFVVPEPFIPKHGAKIMSLQNPTAKMSKSDENVNGFVSICDDDDTIRRKFRRAVTDSGKDIIAGEGKEGITNLLTIYSSLEGISIEDAEKVFKGASYAEFKDAVADRVIKSIAPVRERKDELMKDKDALDEILAQGADKARYMARKTLSKVYRKVGFLPRKR